MRSAALSDPGLVREDNEDAYIIAGPIAAVADGMGGHQAGEVASKTTLTEFAKATGGHMRRPTATLFKAFSQANAAVLRQAKKSDQAGMGSTLTAVILKDRRAWIGHIGDSRAYLLRKDKLTQLTQDHSLVADLLRSGNLSPKEARAHPRRHIITKAVGSHEVIQPDVFSLNLSPGDRLILCTDGLTNHVGSDKLAKLAAGDNLESACRGLVEAAKAGGGSDNITVVIVEPTGADGVPARRPPWAGLLALAAVIAILILGAALVSSWLNKNFYLASSGKYVAVGRGLPTGAAGYKLGRLERVTSIRIDSLPIYYRRRLSTGLVVGDEKRLKGLLLDLRQLSKRGRNDGK